MKLTEQLHKSATHKPGKDPACPVCNPLIGIIADLNRRAKQNEKDSSADDMGARAVAGEQRRMIGILRSVLNA